MAREGPEAALSGVFPSPAVSSLTEHWLYYSSTYPSKRSFLSIHPLSPQNRKWRFETRTVSKMPQPILGVDCLEEAIATVASRAESSTRGGPLKEAKCAMKK